jgi:hypothetical protein
MKSEKRIRGLTVIGSVTAIATMTAVVDADPIVVSPGNMNGWTLNVFDGNGNIATSAPYTGGTAAMVSGPATPPLGVGSAHLATAPGGGDGAAAIATEGYDGAPLSSITSLSYAAYCVTNNGSQFPYLAVSINTGAVDTTGAGNTNAIDTLFLEPPYQQAATGNPALTDQGNPVLNQWQFWSANNLNTGGFWDNLGVVSSPGANAGPGAPGVQPLSAFLAAYPDATIASSGFPGLGGIALQVGFASGTDNFDGYVDDFTIGVNGVNTTYDFEPNAVPEPASFSLLGIGALALLRRRRRPKA